MSARSLRLVLGTDPLVTEFQGTQTAAGVRFLVVGRPDLTALTAAVVAAMRRYGVQHPQIEVDVVDRLQRHRATGKFTRFIPLR